MVLACNDCDDAWKAIFCSNKGLAGDVPTSQHGNIMQFYLNRSLEKPTETTISCPFPAVETLVSGKTSFDRRDVPAAGKFPPKLL